MKYTDTMIGFREVPDEVSLCINISGCPNKCPSCHSKELWEDVGYELDFNTLKELIVKNEGITCVCFMGGDNDVDTLLSLLKYTKDNFDIKTCWYSGITRTKDNMSNLLPYLNYVKIGPFIDEYGSLDKKTTNQKFFHVDNDLNINDITNLFWR